MDQVNSVGELIYSGKNVSMGYSNSINDLELGDVNKGVLRTGDLAKFDSEGFFYIEGSANRFIKIYGNRISLDSLEKIIFSKGFESVAIGSENNLVIYVIYNKNLSPNCLKVDILEAIGINQSAIQINVISDFPRLDNGKINYKVIKNIK
jgi:acyl-CoA synthetase (AMP-forming)/AMP-acid ligase II